MTLLLYNSQNSIYVLIQSIGLSVDGGSLSGGAYFKH